MASYGVAAIGIDEHVWRHTRRGDNRVTVIIDLTGMRDGTGPARQLDMVEGRSKQAFKTWLADRDKDGCVLRREVARFMALIGFAVVDPPANAEPPARTRPDCHTGRCTPPAGRNHKDRPHKTSGD